MNRELKEMEKFFNETPYNRKTLKRSTHSKNLYSNINSRYGKLKRELELPVDADVLEVLDALKSGLSATTNKGQNQATELMELSDELDELIKKDLEKNN
jgi:hypothetical protein